MPAVSPSECVVCRSHLTAFQRYLDGEEHRSVADVLSSVQSAVADIRRSRCGVPPERVVLPVAIRLVLRDDVDETTRSSLLGWVNSL